MALEAPRGVNNRPKNPDNPGHDRVDPKIADDGTIWYLDKAGNVVKLDEAGDEEFNRQQKEPGTPPAPGYPEFTKRVAFANPLAAPEPRPNVDPNPEPRPAPPGPTPIDSHGILGGHALSAAELARVRTDLSNRLNNIQGNVNDPRFIQDLRQRLGNASDQHEIDQLSGLIQRFEPREQSPNDQEQPPRGRGPIDPHQVVGDRPDRGGQGPDWRNVDERRYVGLKIKPIREVLASERDAQLFGEALKAINPDMASAVLDRYRANNPSKEDMDFMTYAGKEYALRLKLAEDVSAKMTKEEIELLSRRNKDFENLLSHEGDKRASDIVKNVIFHTAMKRPDDVADMRDTFSALARDRETSRYKQLEKRKNALCETVGIAPKEYGKVFDMSSQAGRQATEEDLRKRFHERAGKFRRALDWLGEYPYAKLIQIGSSRHAALRAMDKADMMGQDWTYHMSLSDAVKRIDDGLESIARYVGPTISDPEMRSLVAQEVIENRNLQPSIENGPRTFKQVQTLNRDRYSEQSIENRIRQRMQSPNWPQDAAAQDNELRQMRDQEQEEQSGGGFWAWFFSALFSNNFNKAASKAANRQVRV